jgi:putative RNA 2'-phosphotransferase
MNSKLEKISRYLAKLLRHNPENLQIDTDGYVVVADLLRKLDITAIDLDWIVDNNDKKRFVYNLDKSLIRAAQGHNKSLSIDIKMQESPRANILFHGTATANLKSISNNGLVPRNRKHVHLSTNKETALKVALRHSKDVVILEVNSAQMRADGVKIFISENNVYLTDHVDPKYIIFPKSPNN